MKIRRAFKADVLRKGLAGHGDFFQVSCFAQIFSILPRTGYNLDN